MDFSINFSTQAAILFSQGRLKIDRFKCPDWPELIDEASGYRPVAVHFNLNAGRGKLENKDLKQVARLAAQTATPFVNLHLDARAADFPGIPGDTTDPGHLEQIYQKLVADAIRLVETFGAGRVIVENVPYHSGGNVIRPAVEPELITRIVEETGCGLLLDLAHARITACYFGIEVSDYINRLPVSHLKEMHFTGVRDLGGRLQDHLPAQEEDWQNLEWALDQIRLGIWPSPWMVAFEYGGVGEKFIWRSSAQAIEENGRKLYNLIKSI